MSSHPTVELSEETETEPPTAWHGLVAVLLRPPSPQLLERLLRLPQRLLVRVLSFGLLLLLVALLDVHVGLLPDVERLLCTGKREFFLALIAIGRVVAGGQSGVQ